MLPDRFPERVDPQRIFANHGSISSEIPLGSFDRLQQYLRSDDGLVNVRLDFGFDDNGRRKISGTVSARVSLRCERCLEDMPFDIASHLDVLVLASEAQARALPAGTEAIVPDDDGLDLRAVVEDELILSLPIVPHHEDAACSEDLNRLKQSERPEPGESSPFAKLRELKLAKVDEKAEKVERAVKGEPRDPRDED